MSELAQVLYASEDDRMSICGGPVYRDEGEECEESARR